MKYITFAEEAETYKVAILIKASGLDKKQLQSYYIDALEAKGINKADVIAFSLAYDSSSKVKASTVKDYLTELLPVIDSLKITHLYVTDGTYFKTLTKSSKAEPHLGYVLPCSYDGYSHLNIVLGVNYQTLFYNPEQSKLEQTLTTLSEALVGNYTAPGSSIIHSAHYPSTLVQISAALENLKQYKELTADIEAFSLDFSEAGVGSIAFSWNKHNGIAFSCDYEAISPKDSYFGRASSKLQIRALIKKFLSEYNGRIIWHNASYDIKVLIYTLWMKDALDTEGLLEGLEVLTRSFHDTRIIAYLATNSTAGNVLSLKALAQPFAGNWAQDSIKDIRRIPLEDLLQYNLVDCLSTWYVKDTYYPVLLQDNQEDIYESLMLPSLKTIIQMELTGMPMNETTLLSVKAELEQQQQDYLSQVMTSSQVQATNLVLQQSAMESANAKLKTKQHPLEKFKDVVFNPNSGLQLQVLLYEHMKLPVLDYTDSKQPATGASTIEKLINHTNDPSDKALLSALIGYGKVNKILSTFIPAFERGLDKADGRKYLHGNFNLGGTVSGRLSSSEPNLQNLPSGSTFGKLIKKCFSAPPGWLMVGADFSSLEDYISALTTKDPNKLAVYINGFDGHCLRAAYYFRDQCPEIDLSDPTSVNTIKKKYPQLRQDSKAPTFLLTYGGTYHGMMNNLGWDEAKSKSIEKGYHDLYKVSDAYVQDKIKQASKDGYVEVAFGLRVRTPLLKQVVYGSSRMPYEASAEARTAGNALGQSYCLLNNRAANAFMQKVWESPYRLDIKPIALIHDAIYLIVKDDVDVVHWVNQELIEAMRWQELPEIQHPIVKIGAALDIFYPDWSNPITLENSINKETLIDVCNLAKNQL